LTSSLDRARYLALDLDHEFGKARERSLDRSLSRVLDQALERARALDRVCAQGVAGRLGISPTEGLAEALLDGAVDDFTSADLTYASRAMFDPTGVMFDLTGVRWSLSGTIWPPEADVKALLAWSAEVEPGSGVLVVKRQGTAWLPKLLADWRKPASQRRAHQRSIPGEMTSRGR
jgi:hypothetical protein